MLSPTAKTKRYLETIQVVLSFASVCAVVDASFVRETARDPAGYHAGGSPQGEARADRLLSDLARTERKRREAALREALDERQLRA
jgi:hypothetical protein